MRILAKWTVDEFHRMIDREILQQRQVELLKGEIVEMTPEAPPHAFYGEEMADYLRSCLSNRALIKEATLISNYTVNHRQNAYVHTEIYQLTNDGKVDKSDNDFHPFHNLHIPHRSSLRRIRRDNLLHAIK